MNDSPDAAQPFPISPSTPDISRKEPIKSYISGSHILFLYRDITPMGEPSLFDYTYVLVVFNHRTPVPLCFVTLESSSVTSNMLCVFDADGSHSNYGSLTGPDLLQQFLDKGMDLLGERFGLDEIEEFIDRPSQRLS